jgi:hypothetical protein
MGMIDATHAGPQYVLPGAEKATHATMARMGSDAPLRSKAPQRHAGPLFAGDTQLDLIDAISRSKARG